MAGFALPRLGMRPRASYSGLRPGPVRGFGPLAGLVGTPRKRAKNAGTAARKPAGLMGFGGGAGSARPFGMIGGSAGGGMKGHQGTGAGLAGGMGSNPHRGMVIRNRNASLAREKGKYGEVRKKPMNSSAAPRQTAQRATKAARGGSRKAAKRLSERY